MNDEEDGPVECRHFDFCILNHHTETSDFFCNHLNTCEDYHPERDD
jgi:hypothetical protein